MSGRVVPLPDSAVVNRARTELARLVDAASDPLAADARAALRLTALVLDRFTGSPIAPSQTANTAPRSSTDRLAA